MIDIRSTWLVEGDIRQGYDRVGRATVRRESTAAVTAKIAKPRIPRTMRLVEVPVYVEIEPEPERVATWTWRGKTRST